MVQYMHFGHRIAGQHKQNIETEILG